VNPRLEYRKKYGWMLQSRDEVDIVRVRRYTGLTLAKWTITIMIGLLVGKIFFHMLSSSFRLIEKYSGGIVGT
jgi:hypothetical protein